MHEVRHRTEQIRYFERLAKVRPLGILARQATSAVAGEKREWDIANRERLRYRIDTLAPEINVEDSGIVRSSVDRIERFGKSRDRP